MSQYVENHLGRNEQIVLKAKKNILYLLPWMLWMLAWLVAAIVAQNYVNDMESGASSLSDADGIGQTLTIIIWVLFGLCGVLVFVRKLLYFLSLNLALTNKRVVGKMGILRVYSVDITIDKIDNVQIKASILGNLFRYYEMRVASVGGVGSDASAFRKRRNGNIFVGISNAQAFKDAVTAAVEQHAEEARAAQAEAIARAMNHTAS